MATVTHVLRLESAAKLLLQAIVGDDETLSSIPGRTRQQLRLPATDLKSWSKCLPIR